MSVDISLSQIFIGIFLFLLTFLIKRAFTKLDACQTKDDASKELERLDKDLTALSDRVGKELVELKKTVVTKDRCVLVKETVEKEIASHKRNYDMQMVQVHKRIDEAHIDNKEAHLRLEKMLERVGKSLETISECVTKLSANIQCN